MNSVFSTETVLQQCESLSELSGRKAQLLNEIQTIDKQLIALFEFPKATKATKAKKSSKSKISKVAVSTAKRKGPKKGTKFGPRKKNKWASLKECVKEVLANGPKEGMTAAQICEAVVAVGYKTSSANMAGNVYQALHSLANKEGHLSKNKKSYILRKQQSKVA
jgi:hypothetical protein